MRTAAAAGGLVPRVHLRFAYQLYAGLECGDGAGAAPGGFLHWPAFCERMAWADLLRTFSWDAWCSPTFAVDGVSERRARAMVLAWLRHQGPRAYAAVVVERGPAGGLIHSHALVGGLRRTAPKHPLPLAMGFLGDSWRHGKVDVDAYAAARDRPCSPHGASFYITKGGWDAVTLIGQPVVYRPRTRGPRTEGG